jgi:hypothetical protein
MADVAKSLDSAIALLREGKATEADELISALKAELAVESGASTPHSPPPPREPLFILIDFAQAVSEEMGSPPALKRLVAEMQATIKPPPPAAAAAKA